MNDQEIASAMDDILISNLNLELTREAWKLYLFSRAINEKEISDAVFLIVKNAAEHEWGDDTVCYILGVSLIVENFDGRKEIIC